MSLQILVCRECLDIPQSQLRPIVLPPDPVPIFNPRPEAYTQDDNQQGFSLESIWPDTVPTAPNKATVLAQLALLTGIPVPYTTLIDRSITITTPTVAQSLLAPNPTRSWLAIYNPMNPPFGFSKGVAAFNRPPSTIVNGVGDAWFWATAQGNAPVYQGAMTAVGNIAGQQVWCWEAPQYPLGFINDGGALQLVTLTGYPTSPIGLPAGSVWNNGLLVCVVPGIVPNPAAPPIYFGNVGASYLLGLGGGNLPLNNPGAGSKQLWNDGGMVAIA